MHAAEYDELLAYGETNNVHLVDIEMLTPGHGGGYMGVFREGARDQRIERRPLATLEKDTDLQAQLGLRLHDLELFKNGYLALFTKSDVRARVLKAKGWENFARGWSRKSKGGTYLVDLEVSERADGVPVYFGVFHSLGVDHGYAMHGGSLSEFRSMENEYRSGPMALADFDPYFTRAEAELRSLKEQAHHKDPGRQRPPVVEMVCGAPNLVDARSSGRGQVGYEMASVCSVHAARSDHCYRPPEKKRSGIFFLVTRCNEPRGEELGKTFLTIRSQRDAQKQMRVLQQVDLDGALNGKMSAVYRCAGDPHIQRPDNAQCVSESRTLNLDSELALVWDVLSGNTPLGVGAGR